MTSELTDFRDSIKTACKSVGVRPYPLPNPKPRMRGDINGNAFAVIAAVTRKLKEVGYCKEGIDQYMEEARSSDYDHLLYVSQEYVTFVFPKYQPIWDEEEGDFVYNE